MWPFKKKKTGKLYNGDSTQMGIATGYNIQLKQYFIRITDKKTKITCRINMTEDEYHNLWNGANFTAKQHDDRSYRNIA